jgi:nucleoside-diphosphate-sugar epimerase
MSNNEVLIIGCGYVGLALAERLVRQGVLVHAITRSSQIKLEGIKSYQCDLTDFERFPKIKTDKPLLVVFAVAAAGRSESAYRAAYITALKNSLQALADQKLIVERFIFISSTGVYGQDNGEEVDETSTTDPKEFNGKILLQAESITKDCPFPNISIRFSGIYGPGRERMLSLAEDPSGLSIERLHSYSNRIHRDDCAAMIEHLLKFQNPASCYIGSDNEPALTKDILVWLRTKQNIDIPDNLKFQSDNLSNKRCINKLIRATGFQFIYPTYREGL